MSVDALATGDWRPCPHLGVVGDPYTRCLYVHGSHRCYAGSRPMRVGEEEQASLCLSGEYARCPRSRGGEGEPARGPRRRLPTARLPEWAGWNRLPEWAGWNRLREWAGSIRLPEWSGWNRLLARPVAVVAGVVAVLALLLAVVFTLLSPPEAAPTSASPAGGVAPGAEAAPPQPAPTGEAPASPIALPAAAPTVAAPPANPTMPPRTPTPGMATAAPTPAPAAPTAAPRLPAPVPGRVYVVKAGDTLWSISTAEGVAVEEIMRANDLTDRNFVWSGQRLIIPTPASVR